MKIEDSFYVIKDIINMRIYSPFSDTMSKVYLHILIHKLEMGYGMEYSSPQN